MTPADEQKKRRREIVTKLNKRLRKETRLTPWKDAWELESVGCALLSIIDDPSQTTAGIQDSLETVAIWKARSHATEALPHAVESTAMLAEIYWRDQTRAGSSVTELRLAYSSAIVRCINGFADALQQQRFVAAPVSVLCGQLGIPSWLVDIRHEASHNALPTLPVLRLATVTLLEYLRSQYWIPTCPNWTGSGTKEETKVILPDEVDGTRGESAPQPKSAIEILLEYKSCVTKLQADEAKREGTIVSSSSESKASIGKKSIPSKPFDTFFGDDEGDSSDDSDDEVDDPLLGSLWGPSVGTNNNRFSLLQAPKKENLKKKKPKKPKKAPPQKKLAGVKYPMDFAKEFVESVTPQEGYPTAIQFLVWGGIGGTAEGRGVLIPGSLSVFPATGQGIRKSWERYLPLVEVLGRVWPGFSSALLIHLVAFVLTIENDCARQNAQDPGSVRKLFFLSSWIRLLVSQEFVQLLYPEGKRKSKKVNHAEIPLASFEQLQPFRYPLNSLCDRCSESNHPEWNRTSMDILIAFETILGAHRVKNHGIAESPCGSQDATKSDIPETDENALDSGEIVEHGPSLPGGKMSLDEIEAILSSEDESQKSDSRLLNEPNRTPAISAIDSTVTSARPIAWTRCTAWDECAIGTLPGNPV